MTAKKSAEIVVEVRDGHSVVLEEKREIVEQAVAYGAGSRLSLPRAKADELIAAGDVVEVDES